MKSKPSVVPIVATCDFCMRSDVCEKHSIAKVKAYDKTEHCPHQFFKIADETKKEGEQIQITIRWGVKIMCALCGQRRILWTDGEVEIL